MVATCLPITNAGDIPSGSPAIEAGRANSGVTTRTSGAAWHTPYVNALLSPWVVLAVLIVAGLVLRYFLAPLGRMPFDFIVFGSWSYTLTNEPLASFYAIAYVPLHLPGSLWFLWFVAHAYAAVTPGSDFSADTYLLYLKTVPFLADIGIAVLLFVLASRSGKTVPGLWVAGAYLLNPATLFVSATWGQWDSLSAFFALAAIVALFSNRVGLSVPSLALACLIKPQFVLLAPIVLIYALRRYGPSWSVPRLLLGGAASGVMATLLLLPFSVSVWLLPTTWTLWDRVKLPLEFWPLTTVRAANVWSFSPGAELAGPDAVRWGFLTYQHLGTVLVLACYAFILIVLATCTRNDLELMTLWSAYCATFALFMLATRVHERYLLPSIVFLTALLLYTRFAAVVLPILTVTFLANLIWVFDIENAGMDWRWLNSDLAVRALSGVNLVLLIVSLLMPLFRRDVRWRTSATTAAYGDGESEVDR